MWNGIRGTLRSLIADVAGTPFALRELLATGVHKPRLEAPERSTAESAVVKWHDWSSHSAFEWPRRAPGELRGWSKRRDVYASQLLRMPEMASIGAIYVHSKHTVDLREIDGFAASKSDLHEHRTVEEFAERRCPDWIADVSHAQLQKMLSHDEIRVLHAEHHTDHFSQYGWDGRVFLSNAGGSHHTAAAQYVAKRLQADVPLHAPLRVYTLNEGAVCALIDRYELFSVPDESSFQCAFHDALESIRATYFWHSMPAPYHDQRAILLPRDNARSMAVAKEMRSAGVADLGCHLGELLERQQELRLTRKLRLPSGRAVALGTTAYAGGGRRLGLE